MKKKSLNSIFFLTCFSLWVFPVSASALTPSIPPIEENIEGIYDGECYTYEVPIGTPIYSVCSGVVTKAGWESGAGNCITIQNPQNETFTYQHLSEITVKGGEVVVEGQQIGFSGNTGSAQKSGELVFCYEIDAEEEEEEADNIDQLWEKNALSQFAEKEKLAIDFENSQYSLVQFNCKLTGLTVDELSAKLRHQVIQKTDKDHRHDWMYFDVTDEDGNEKLFRYCQSCEKWQAFEAE